MPIDLPDYSVEPISLRFVARRFQTECMTDMRRFNVYVVHRRAGKSAGTIMKLLDSASRTRREFAQYAFIGPYQAQTYKIAWNFLSSKASLIPGTRLNDGHGTGPSSVVLPNKATVWLWGGDNPKAIRGTYLDGCGLDELADIKPYLWEEVVYPMLNDSGRKGWAILQGTPKGVNLLSERFYAAQTDPMWSAKKFTIYDTGVYSLAEIEQMRKDMKPEKFAQEYLCDFSAGNNSTLLSEAEVTAAMNRTVPFQSYRYAPRVMGIDVARQGDDSSVFFKRQGLMSWEPMPFRLNDSMLLAAKAQEEIQKFKPDAVFVDGSGGYGAGVIDRLRQLGNTNIIEVQFGGAPTDERFQNKRMEMHWRQAEWVKKGGCLFNHQRMKLDLCAPEYTYANARGKMALESKESMKDRGLPSPDYGDAGALTHAEDVTPLHEVLAYKAEAGHNDVADTTYHPFD